MKSLDDIEVYKWRGRSPCGERGLKSLDDIEVYKWRGRSPCGERGLKLHVVYSCYYIFAP